MAFSLSTYSIKNPIPAIITFLLLTIAGITSCNKLAINNFPSIVFPIISISVSLPNASPSEIETQITRKVETSLAGIDGLKRMNSSISEGHSETIIEFELTTNIYRALDEVRSSISRIRSDLGKSIEEPLISTIDTDSSPILTYIIKSAEMHTEELSWFVDDKITRELLAVPGVNKIQRSGGANKEITLNLDPHKLTKIGISAAEIGIQLNQNNANFPAGKIEISEKEYLIRVLGSASSIQELKDRYISLSSGKKIKISDLGELSEFGADPKNITKLDGRPVITFDVFKSKNANEIKIAQEIEKKIAKIQGENKLVSFEKIFSLPDYTMKTLSATIYGFLEGATLTVIIVFIFLKDKRATVIAAITIPLSIIPTFFIMDLLGFSINGITLLAISLVTGVLVDDAIVEIENIHRFMLQGKKPFEAAIIAAEEIGLAVIATTLVICAVFIPVSFINNFTGQYFKEFGLTVATASLFSLLVARLITPMLAAHLLKPLKKEEHIQSKWMNIYLTIINWTLANRLKTLLIALSIMIISFSMLSFIKKGFLPYEDHSEANLVIELPQGSVIELTDSVACQITEILKSKKEVSYVLSAIYNEVNTANLKIKLVDPKDRKISQKEFENEIVSILKTIPDIKFYFANSFGHKDINIILASDYSEELFQTAAELEKQMKTIEGLTNISIGGFKLQNEIAIIPDFARAAELGISAQTISNILNILTIGDHELNLAKFELGNRQIPIRIKIKKDQLKSIEMIKNIPILSANGKLVPLSRFASITMGTGPAKIERFNREVNISLDASLVNLSLGDALDKIYKLSIFKNMSNKIRIIDSGNSENMKELFSGFSQAILLGITLVYLIQVLLYKDWIHPVTRMAALPLSIGGAIFLLIISGNELNLPSIIGILMLIGISDKNSILLVDHMLESMKRGIDKKEAIINACFIRSRPIMMTTFAMIAGMLPVVFGITGSEFKKPMALAVIGGLISSTMLSLILVPVLFSYVRDFEEFIMKKKI